MDTETRETEAWADASTWKPAAAPGRQSLAGRYGAGSCRSIPAVMPHDLFEASHGARGDPAIWNYLGYGPFSDEAAFTAWLAERAASTIRCSSPSSIAPPARAAGHGELISASCRPMA